MDKSIIRKGTGVKPAILWNDAVEAVFKFRVFRCVDSQYGIYTDFY